MDLIHKVHHKLLAEHSGCPSRLNNEHMIKKGNAIQKATTAENQIGLSVVDYREGVYNFFTGLNVCYIG